MTLNNKNLIAGILMVILITVTGVFEVKGQWVESIGESAGFTSGNSVAADNQGNAYITGISFVNEDQFQGSDPGNSDTVTNFQQRRIFINKYDQVGNVVWSNSLATDSVRAWSNGIGVDDNNNVYITGFYQDSLLYDNGNFFYNPNEPTMFLAKYNADGSFGWIINVPVSGPDTIVPFSLAVDDSGNCYVGGAYQGNVTIASASLSSVENQFFLAKFNTNGNFQWVESGANSDQGAYLADLALQGDTIFVAGNFIGNLDIGANNLTSSGGSSNIFLAKYTDGVTPTLVFAKSEQVDTVTAIGIAAQGNILLTGKYYNPAIFAATPSDVNLPVGGGDAALFIAKYDLNGNFLWAKEGTVNAGKASGTGIGADPNNNIYLTGTFGQLNNAATLTIDGLPVNGFLDDDLFYASFNEFGNVQWIEVAADSLNDRSNDLVIANASQIYITGNYQDSITIGNDVAGREFSGRKGFVAQIDICPATTATITSSQDEICMGEMTTLQATINPAYTYQWIKDKIPIPGADNDFIEVSDSGEYFVEILDTGLCTKTSNRISVNPFPIPVPEIVLNSDSVFCRGDTIILSTNTNANSNYQWMLNGSPTSLADTLGSVKVYASGSYQVEETNNFGCSNTSEAQNVNVLEFPDTSISINGDSVFCTGETRILQAAQNSDYSYQWYLGDDLLVNDTLSALTVETGGNYRVKIVNLERCLIESNIKNIAVIEKPEAILEAGGATSFCDGNLVTLYANTGVNLIYQWYNDGVLMQNDSLDRLTVITTGNYQVVITNSTGCSATSNEINVTVYDNPVASFDLVGEDSFCKGDSASLNALTQANLTYQWKLYSNPIVGATGTSLNISNTGSYTLEVFDQNQCTDVSEAVFIEVNPIPDAFILPLGVTTFCEGESVQLAANSGNNFSYQWFDNGEAITNSDQVNYTADATGAYTVKVTNENNCSFVSDSLVVTVNPVPDAEVVVEDSPEVCEGETVVLKGVEDPGYSYQWFEQGIKIDSANTSQLLVTTSGSYHLSVLSNQLCISRSDELEIEVKPNKKPEITFTKNNVSTSFFPDYQWLLNGNPIQGANNQIYEFNTNGAYAVAVTNDNGCFNTSEVLDLCSPAPVISPNQGVLTSSEGSSYQWYQDGKPIADAIQQKYAVLEAGNYSVEVTNADGCVSMSRSIKRCFPHPKIEASPDFTLVSSVGISYQWFKDDILIPGENNQIYEVTDNGMYTVQVTSYEDCNAISDPARILVTGIEDNDAKDQNTLELYPNPASNTVHISYQLTSPSSSTLLIVDGMGRTIHALAFESIHVNQTVDLFQFKNGVYYAVLIEKEGRIIKKFVVSK